jgi:hypothetical protein
MMERETERCYRHAIPYIYKISRAKENSRSVVLLFEGDDVIHLSFAKSVRYSGNPSCLWHFTQDELMCDKAVDCDLLMKTSKRSPTKDSFVVLGNLAGLSASPVEWVQ